MGIGAHIIPGRFFPLCGVALFSFAPSPVWIGAHIVPALRLVIDVLHLAFGSELSAPLRSGTDAHIAPSSALF